MKKINITDSPWVLSIVFITTAVIMTLYESLKELLFEGALTPWQSHTITIIITSVIATFAAQLMRSWVLSLHSKEKDIQIKEQSLVSFQLILSAVNHIVNNVLNYLQLIKLEIEDDGKINPDTMKLLDDSIKEADNQMKILNKIQTPADPDSYKGIYPK